MEERHISIGQSVHRIDAFGKVTGETPYPGDIDLEGQLWMKIRFSDRVHARITAIDTSRAEAYPGVVAVFTAKDVPVNEYGLGIPDQPVLCGPGSAKPGADIVRCISDQVALVVAESEEAATAAVKLIDVQYEDLPAVTDVLAAMEDGAPQLHAEYPNNILCHYKIRHGDIEEGWRQAEVVVEGEYRTGYQEHAYLQPEAGLGYIDEEGRITVLVAGQWVHEDREQVAHALGLPEDQIRIIYPAIGGAFGGREDMSVQIVLALAAWKLQRPVKIIWSREESIIGHHKRHPTIIRAKWGATRDGKVVAAEATVIGDAGAYAYTTPKVMGNAHLMVSGPYAIPNAHIDTYGVYTNNIPTGAFRGFGGPQGCFAAEGQMNKLAEALGMDPVEIRMRNVLRDGSITVVGSPLPQGVTLEQVLAEGAGQSGYWTKSDHGWERCPYNHATDSTKRRGVGVAMGFKNIGFSFGAPEHSYATVELHGGAEIERVVVHQAGADVGQGAHTVFRQMAAEAVGVPLEKVELLGHDTATAGNSGSSSASRMTFMAGNAIKGAAEEALEKWRAEERPAIATYKYVPPRTTPYDKETGRANPNFAYGYMAQIVEVEVDIETGHVTILRVVSAHDVGKAINPQQIVGQIEGAVVQAAGYAIMENLISRDGRILNPYLSTYLIPTVLDIPLEVKPVILEYGDPNGPWGAKGMAEMPFIPLAPAITAALHDATGIWFDEIPLIPERVIAGLRQHGYDAFSDVLVIVRGGGDLATGVVYRLSKAGFPVIVMELPQPLAIRRAVAIASAVFDGALTIEDLSVRRVATPSEARVLAADGTIPVLVDPEGESLRALRPAVVVDARMAKRNLGTRPDDAPLVIALGPGFSAGGDCHAVIETNRGHRLGRVIWSGPAEPNTGRPGVVQGRQNDRVLRAPADGTVEPHCAIGDFVREGDLIATVGGEPLRAPFDGVLRGLIHPSVSVTTGMKIGDLDPRGERDYCFEISEKSLAIGGGVVEAVLSAPQIAPLLSASRNRSLT